MEGEASSKGDDEGALDKVSVCVSTFTVHTCNCVSHVYFALYIFHVYIQYTYTMYVYSTHANVNFQLIALLKISSCVINPRRACAARVKVVGSV